MAWPAARAEDPASTAIPSPAATSSQTLAGLCVSNGMRGTKPSAAAASTRMPRSPLPGRQAHERLVADVGEPGHAPGERMPSRRGGQHDGLGGQRLAEIGGGQVVVDGAQRHVDPARVQVREEIRDEAGAQGDGHPGIAAVESGQGAGQVDRGEQLGRADPQLPPGHRGQLGQVGPGPLDLGERAARPGQHQLARGREADPARGALEQGRAELPFQPADLGGHRGLGDVQLLGGPAEPAVPHDRLEVSELP